ncbi:hypothetical protein [Butyrivibrio sp. FCS014]|uniref:hypothetical protein n=1 Tax=Butyrivibrio sp. FCS014 TaxID=1408304 RepID=UPI00068674B9|nr:hypothetical protein [Butyrivibrio sp. FCS014]
MSLIGQRIWIGRMYLFYQIKGVGFTDDSVMSLAIKTALVEKKDLVELWLLWVEIIHSVAMAEDFITGLTDKIMSLIIAGVTDLQ